MIEFKEKEYEEIVDHLEKIINFSKVVISKLEEKKNRWHDRHEFDTHSYSPDHRRSRYSSY